LELNNKVPNEDDPPLFLPLTLESAKKKDSSKLIEVQGFPSLYNYQAHLYEKFVNQYPFLSELTPFFNGLSTQNT
jgi:hypothetical protein